MRYFVAVADAGSVNAAAQTLHLTQPSLARQLHQLERRLNLVLLEPRGGRLVLTSAGRRFLPHARELLARADAASAAAADLAAGRLPSVRVAAPAAAVSGVLAPYIAGLGPDDLCPRVITTASGRAACDRLDTDADLAVVAEPPSPGLNRLRLLRVPIRAYVRADHRHAARGLIDVAELAAESLVLAADDADVRDRMDALLTHSGTARPGIDEVDSPRLAHALAASGRGLAIGAEEARFGLVPLRIMGSDGALLALDLHATWKPAHHASTLIGAFARRLQRTATAPDERTRGASLQRSESAA